MTDIGSYAITKCFGLDHICSRAKTQHNETRMVFIFELGVYDDPSIGIAVRYRVSGGKTSPRLDRFRSARLQSKSCVVTGPVAELCC